MGTHAIDSRVPQWQGTTDVTQHTNTAETSNSNQLRQRSGVSLTQRQGQSLERVGETSVLPIKLSTLASNESSTPGKRLIAQDFQKIYNALYDQIKEKSDHSFQQAQDKELSPAERKRAEVTFTKHNQAVNTLVKELAPALEKYQGKNGIVSIEDTATLSLGLDTLAKQLPKGGLKELSRLLALHVKSDWMQMEKDQLRDVQLEKLAPLGKPGAGMATTYKIGLNAGGSLLSVPGTEAKVGPYGDASLTASHEVRLNPDDEGLFFKEKSEGINFGVKGGVEASVVKDVGLKAELGGQVQYNRTTFKEWNNVEGYVDKEGHKLDISEREQYGKKSLGHRIWLAIKNHLPFKPGSELKRYQEVQQQAANSQHRLNDLIHSELSFDANVNAPSPKRTKPLMGVYHTWTGAASLTAKAGATFEVGALDVKGGAALGATRQKSVTNIYEFVPSQLSDVIQKNASRLKELPGNFTQHARAITQGSSDPRASIGGLKLLEQDVEQYYEVTQRYDDLKSSPDADRAALKLLQQQKHQIENRWGAIGRHQFLQFASASHAYFADQIMPEGKFSDAIAAERQKEMTDLIGQTAVKIQNPEIDYSKKRLDKIASFEQVIYLQVSDVKTSINLTIGPFSGQLDILQRDRIHPSRIREGRYMDITLTGKVSGSVQSLVDKATITAKIKEAAAKEGIELPGDLNISPDLGGGASISRMVRYFEPKYSQTDDFTGEKGWRKQLVRDTGGLSSNFNLGLSGTVAAGAHAGANIGVSHNLSTVFGETMGTEDITYTITRFNRFFRDAGLNSQNEAWKDFFQAHKNEFRDIFKNLGDSQHPMTQEVQYFFKELITRAQNDSEKAAIEQSKVEFNQIMEDVKTDPANTQNFAKAQQHLESFLEKLTAPWWEAHTGQWKDLEFKQSSDSGLNLGTRVAKGLGIHPRANS
ncbi:hypothetical protein [Algicola sagamiensis]|uniref:hypothetical protein n=1 Tax=Algicola sagamiensis TaxID=163869 RepID=UPI0003770CC7|nr:hypothetical protein [Algicola sagamiensis]